MSVMVTVCRRARPMAQDEGMAVASTKRSVSDVSESKLLHASGKGPVLASGHDGTLLNVKSKLLV
jgi:hypothetical protein